MTENKAFYNFSTLRHAGLIIVTLLFLLTGCQNHPVLPPQTEGNVQILPPVENQSFDEIQTMLLLYQQHELWQGTPYRIGGVSRSGIDCSAFVQVTFRDLFRIDLPRNTAQQARSGRPINRAELRSGDLVFFRKGGHVGIYLENHKFLHASSSKGVIISSLKNAYWSRHYWQAVTLRDE